MSLLKKLKYPIALGAAALAAPYIAPALGGLLGGAGAAGAAGEAAGAALPALLPEATLPALEPMLPATFTFPAGAMPADPLQIELSMLHGAAGPAEGGFSQYASAGDIKGLLGTAANRAGLGGLDGEKAAALSMMLSRSGGQQAPAMGGGQRPPAMPYQPTAGLLSPQQRKRLGLAGYLNG